MIYSVSLLSLSTGALIETFGPSVRSALNVVCHSGRPDGNSHGNNAFTPVSLSLWRLVTTSEVQSAIHRGRANSTISLFDARPIFAGLLLVHV